jgi:hypothetical protein
MLDTGRDVEDGKDGNDLEYPFERHCPECVDKLEEHVRNEEEICGLRDQVVSMRNQRDKALARVDTLLRERTAAPAVVDLTSDEPAAKKRRAKAQSVWVLHKGDWPCEPNAQLVNIDRSAGDVLESRQRRGRVGGVSRGRGVARGVRIPQRGRRWRKQHPDRRDRARRTSVV